MKINRTFLLVIVIICLIVASCNRRQNANPLSNLKFSTITETFGNTVITTRVTYNAQGNVDSMVYFNSDSAINGSGYQKFKYYTNGYAIHRSTGEIDSVVLNNNKITCVYIQSRLIDTLYFFYNSANEITAQLGHRATGSGSKIDSTLYNWGSFDINSIQTATSAGTAVPYYFTVNPNLSGQTGDGLRIGQFLSYGRTYFNTQHLPLYETYYGNTINTYLYQFDAEGRISKLSIAENYSSGASLDTVVYVYSYAN